MFGIRVFIKECVFKNRLTVRYKLHAHCKRTENLKTTLAKIKRYSKLNTKIHKMTVNTNLLIKMVQNYFLFYNKRRKIIILLCC